MSDNHALAADDLRALIDEAREWAACESRIALHYVDELTAALEAAAERKAAVRALTANIEYFAVTVARSYYDVTEPAKSIYSVPSDALPSVLGALREAAEFVNRALNGKTNDG